MIDLTSLPDQVLHKGFVRSAARHADRPALEVAGQRFTYATLAQFAARVASLIRLHCPEGAPRMAAVLASRSPTVYAGLLGTLMSGAAAVPMNPTFPADRSAQMLEHSGARVLVVDDASLPSLKALLQRVTHGMTVILPETSDASALRQDWPQHRFLDRGELLCAQACEPWPVDAESLALIFYTSGSTGRPKGVGVLHRNAARFVEMSLERYGPRGIGCHDRFSQFYDITFDSSMFDLYVCWAFGACLCSPSAVDWVNPNKFIEAHALTVIDIVPSTGRTMNRSGSWRPGRFPALRLCRFGGEALSADLAETLALAAPGAMVDNVYGPTECTVDAAYFEWKLGASAAECEHGVVPVGTAGPQVRLRVVDEQLMDVPAGHEGELLIGGPQVTPGYWNDPERTAAAFVRTPGHAEVFYRTGDLVRQPEPGRAIQFLGRLDHQIKISGVRIELGEIEHALRAVTGAEHAVALGWPRTPSGASGVVAFVSRVAGIETSAVRESLKARLPQVMVPRDIHWVDEFPVNVNGKVDRKALAERLAAT